MMRALHQQQPPPHSRGSLVRCLPGPAHRRRPSLFAHAQHKPTCSRPSRVAVALLSSMPTYSGLRLKDRRARSSTCAQHAAARHSTACESMTQSANGRAARLGVRWYERAARPCGPPGCHACSPPPPLPPRPPPPAAPWWSGWRRRAWSGGPWAGCSRSGASPPQTQSPGCGPPRQSPAAGRGQQRWRQRQQQLSQRRSEGGWCGARPAARTTGGPQKPAAEGQWLRHACLLSTTAPTLPPPPKARCAPGTPGCGTQTPWCSAGGPAGGRVWRPAG